MKTNSLKLLIFLTGIAIMLSTGCTKDAKKTNSDNLSSQLYQHDLKLGRMFKTFKQKGSLKLKDGEDMSVDSAIWYLGGTANYTYGNAAQQASIIVIDSNFISLSVSNKRITLTETYNKYSDLIDTLKADFKKIKGDQKQLMSVQVQSTQLSSSQLVCKVTSIYGNGDPTDSCGFNNVDSWIWWNWSGQGGICAGPNDNGQGGGLDAAQLINRKVMHCKGIPEGYFCWIDQVTVDLEPSSYNNPNWDQTPNYEESRLYFNYQGSPNFHGCLSPAECNFYFQGAQWIVNHPQSQGGAAPDNKEFISIALIGDETSEPISPYYSTYSHHGPAYFGTMLWQTEPAGSLGD